MSNDLPNFHRINENFYRGGQPTEDGIRRLAALGIKTIINFRGVNRRVLREKRIAEENGLQFLNLPLSDWLSPKNSEIEKILEIITNPANQPVFIHCKRGCDRTGTVLAIYRIKFDGWTAAEARREAKERGIGWWQVWMKVYINEYYKDFKGSDR